MEEADRKKLLDFLDTNWPGPKECPICQNDDWFVHASLWEMREFTGGEFPVTGRVVPVIAVECKKCGHLVLFNAIATGLVQAAEEEIESATPQKEEEEDG